VRLEGKAQSPQNEKPRQIARVFRSIPLALPQKACFKPPRRDFSGRAPLAIQEARQTENASAEQNKGARLGRVGTSDQFLRHGIS